jgi:hypothetical protein
MDVVLALIAGLVVGYLVGRNRRDRSGDPTPARFKPSKRQRKILATMPPDPQRPDVEELARIEVTELGADRVEGSSGISPTVLLPVWRRDIPGHETCATGDLRFLVAGGATPGEATVDDVRLTCDGEHDAGTGS